MTNKMQLCMIIYYYLAALHVSSDIRSSSGASKLYYTFWYYTRMSLPAVIMGVLDDERKYRSKHVAQPRNNKLSYTVASCWSPNTLMLPAGSDIRV